MFVVTQRYLSYWSDGLYWAQHKALNPNATLAPNMDVIAKATTGWQPFSYLLVYAGIQVVDLVFQVGGVEVLVWCVRWVVMVFWCGV